MIDVLLGWVTGSAGAATPVEIHGDAAVVMVAAGGAPPTALCASVPCATTLEPGIYTLTMWGAKRPLVLTVGDRPVFVRTVVPAPHPKRAKTANLVKATGTAIVLVGAVGAPLGSVPLLIGGGGVGGAVLVTGIALTPPKPKLKQASGPVADRAGAAPLPPDVPVAAPVPETPIAPVAPPPPGPKAPKERSPRPPGDRSFGQRWSVAAGAGLGVRGPWGETFHGYRATDADSGELLQLQETQEVELRGVPVVDLEVAFAAVDWLDVGVDVTMRRADYYLETGEQSVTPDDDGTLDFAFSAGHITTWQVGGRAMAAPWQAARCRPTGGVGVGVWTGRDLTQVDRNAELGFTRIGASSRSSPS
jgi:hypothetical protein